MDYSNSSNRASLLDSIAHEQTIICKKLFVGRVISYRPMNMKQKALNYNKIYCLK